MNIKNLLCVVCAISLSGAAVTEAQSLVEVARMEKARRAKLRSNAGPAKVYTESDRSGFAGDPAPISTDAAATDAGAAPPTAGAQKEKTPQELAAEQQKGWADKVKVAQDNIKSLEDAIARNERGLASMYNITPARADLANQIEADKQRLVELRQSLVDLEEERRRAGLPRVR
jgi:hypothetical protein